MQNKIMTSIILTLLLGSITVSQPAPAEKTESGSAWHTVDIGTDARWKILATNGIVPTKTKVVFRIVAHSIDNKQKSNVQIGICDKDGVPLSIKDSPAIWKFIDVNQQEEVEIPASQTVSIVIGNYRQPTKAQPFKFVSYWTPILTKPLNGVHQFVFQEPPKEETSLAPAGEAPTAGGKKPPITQEVTIQARLKFPEF